MREVKLLSDQVLDSVDVVEACGGHVNLEPRFVSLAKCMEVPGVVFCRCGRDV